MELAIEPIYYSFYRKNDTCHTKETFVDPYIYNWSREVENNYQLILAEVIEHYKLNEKHFHPYFSKDIVNLPGKWTSFGFYFWGLRAKKAICDDFSVTISLIKNIPGIVSASVSVIDPNSEIKPHFGDTNAIHRFHLGLMIPDKLPTIGLQVGYEKRSWETGKLIVFNDGAYHKAWNYSNEKRIVLIFDVIRPEYLDKKKWICSNVNAVLLQQKLAAQNPIYVKIFKIRVFQVLINFGVYIYMNVFLKKRLWLN